MTSIFFVSPLTALPLRHLHPVRCACVRPRPHPAAQVFMKSNTDSTSGNSGYDDGTVSFGRFREFTSPGGDPDTQNDLVREVLRQATHISTSESMESTIQTHLDAASDLLSEMYSKGEREIEERNHRIAMQTSLPEISKWNKQLIDGNKTSRQHRMEISKELALVDALLKRTARAQKKRKSASRRGQAKDNLYGSQSVKITSLNKSLRRHNGNSRESDSVSISTPGAFLFTAIVCTVALESFDSVTSRDGGAARLADYAALSTLLILSIAYLNAVRTALQRAQDDLHRQTGSFPRGPSNRR